MIRLIRLDVGINLALEFKLPQIKGTEKASNKCDEEAPEIVLTKILQFSTLGTFY